MINLADFTVVLANETQRAQQVVNCYEPFNNDQTFEEFRAVFEDEQANQAWAKDYGNSTWVLVRRDALAGPIYSGLETLRIRAFYRRSNSKKVENGWIYNFTVLVTPPEYRGAGYATHLLRLMYHVLSLPPSSSPLAFPIKWGQPPPPIPSHLEKHFPKAVASILWSEIDVGFYEACSAGLESIMPGWQFSEKRDWQLLWKSLPATVSAAPVMEKPEWEILEVHAMGQVATYLSQATISKLESLPLSDTNIFTPDPTSSGMLTFVAQRARYGPHPQHITAKTPQPMGVRRVRDGQTTIVLFATYNLTYSDRFLITYVHNLHAEHLESLLKVIDRLAEKVGRAEGSVWGLDWDGALAEEWKSLDGRDAKVQKRSMGKGGAILGTVWYGEGEGDIQDCQMWSCC